MADLTLGFSVEDSDFSGVVADFTGLVELVNVNSLFETNLDVR